MYKPSHEHRELQLCELDILKAVDKICKDHKIEYFLYCGTLLGAVKFQGFIPWDDDLDIAMTRENLEKFMLVASEELPNHLFLQSYLTDGYPYFMVKIRNSNTTFIEPHMREMKVNHGVFIDIFTLDPVPADIKERAKFQKKQIRLQTILHVGRIWRDRKKYSFFKRQIDLIISFISRSISQDYLIKKYTEHVTQFEDQETGYIGNTAKAFGLKKSYRNEDIWPLRELQFEDQLFPVPNNFDAVLRQDYGDYTATPPEEQQNPNRHGNTYDVHQSYIHYLISNRK